MTEVDLQQFGGLVANVQTLLDNQKIIKDDLIRHRDEIRLQLYDSNKRIHEKLDYVKDSVSKLEVAVSGMQPICKQHTEDIAKLKERPGRVIEIGAATLSAFAAVSAWFVAKGH